MLFVCKEFKSRGMGVYFKGELVVGCIHLSATRSACRYVMQTPTHGHRDSMKLILLFSLYSGNHYTAPQ